MKYLSEIRDNWRPLLAATIGLGSGLSTAGVITSTIAPTLIRENGWAASDFALIGSLALVTSFAFPFVGRLADVIGVRYTALIGQVATPLAFLAYSAFGASLPIYSAIFFVQAILCVTTTGTVYSRLAVQHVKAARGLALAIVASGPAVSGVIMAPLLNHYVEAHGWRASYQALAIFATIAGMIVFFMIPSAKPETEAVAPPKRSARKDYGVIFRTPAFWILAGTMLLCNLPQTILLVQLKLLLLDNGIAGESAAIMLIAAPLGTLTGRFVAGIALDRFQPYLVSFMTLGLPSIGLFLIASQYDAAAVLTFSVFCVGFAFGAEADIIGFLVARQFGIAIYSSVMGLLIAVSSFSTALGATLLSFTMARTGGYELYLIIVGIAVIIGASFLLLLDRDRGPGKEIKAFDETAALPGAPIAGPA